MLNTVIIMAKIHELKTWPPEFQAIYSGRKTFEVRRNDRDFKEGDEVLLREYILTNGSYTERRIRKKIGFILSNPNPFLYLPDGYVILSLI